MVDAIANEGGLPPGKIPLQHILYPEKMPKEKMISNCYSHGASTVAITGFF